MSMRAQRIGAATVHVVPEFSGNPMPLTVGMPEVAEADLRAARAWLSDPNLGETPEESVLCLSWHTFVVHVAGKTVLIDTGLGNQKDRPDFIEFANGRTTDFFGALETAGVRPDEVDLVVCTHLHFDHVGWNTRLTDAGWVPSFPNADYIFSRADFDHYREEAQRHSVHTSAFDDSVLPVVNAGLATLIEPGHVLIDDGVTRLWLEGAAGHSPGSLLVRLHSIDSEAVFTGDLIHHPIQLVRPEINLSVEEQPEDAARTRIRLISELADSGSVVCPAHFSVFPMGRISREGNGYRWKRLGGDSNE